MTVVNRQVYITLDGREFTTEKEAKEHEVDIMKPRVYLVVEQISSTETIKFATGCSTTAATVMSSFKKKNQEHPEFMYSVKNLILDEEL